MNTSDNLPSIEDLKQQARMLRRALGGEEIGHSHALELIAKTYGYRDWNSLHAAAGNRPAFKLEPGQRVTGAYLGQRFAGEIVGVVRRAGERYHVTLQFDHPVDVITFEGMSNFRSRVSCVINSEGVTAEKTSNGLPHLRISEM